MPSVRALRTTPKPALLDYTQGTLALAIPAAEHLPTTEPVDPHPGADVIAIDRALRLRFERWAYRYAQAAVEIASGDRPVTQVLRWTSSEVYHDLSRRAQLIARAARSRPGERGSHGARPTVVGMHSCFIARNIVEASIHVRYGQHSRAVAARFEIVRGRWHCCALEFA
jgi:hypothetical protein